MPRPEHARRATDDSCAAAERVVDELPEAPALVGVDERADLHAGLGAPTDPEPGHLGGEPRGELLDHRLGHEKPVGRGAGLAAVAHLGQGRALDGGLQVGVLEDEERGIAAELHRHAQHLIRRPGHEPAADLGRAGEGQLAQAGILDQRSGHRARGRAGDDVQDPRGQACPLEDVCQREGRERRLPRGLDDERAAGREGRCDGPSGHHQWEVPRRDHQAGAHRLAHHEHATSAVGAQTVGAVQPQRLSGEEPQVLGGVGDLGEGLG